MTWMIAVICAALTAWIVEWAQRRLEQWSEDQAWAKAQGDTGKRSRPGFESVASWGGGYECETGVGTPGYRRSRL